jgi:uncharacterized metal-binding protein
MRGEGDLSSGRTHAFVSTLAGGIIAGSMVSLDVPSEIVIAVATGCFSGILLSPDHDLSENGNVTHSLVRNDFGDTLWLIWSIMWYPYGRLITHRHFLSHTPVVSTIIRVMYVGLLPYIVVQLLDIDITIFDILFAYWFVGLCVSDTLHWIFDQF